MKNPFTPSFGTVPETMAGRDQIISDLMYAYDNGPGDPGLSTILIGARGTGKTALLTYISSEVRQNGWISVDVQCRKGMLEDIYQNALMNASHLLDLPVSKLSQFSVKMAPSGIGMEAVYKPEAAPSPNWRLKMTDLIQKLNAQGIGLLITVDEVVASIDEMREFVSTYQMFVREGLKVALLMAGLPKNVSLLINDGSVSFLRRAAQYYLDEISDAQVSYALEETVRKGGKTITKEALQIAVEAVGGFAFMLQLVGYHSWKLAADKAEIDAADVQRGVVLAQDSLKQQVLKTTVDDLSNMSLKFLNAMLEDDKPSSMKDISHRMGKSTSYLSTYKRKLQELGIISEIRNGYVDFALPYMREFLREYGV